MNLARINRKHLVTIDDTKLEFSSLGSALHFIIMRDKAIKKLEDHIEELRFIANERSEAFYTIRTKVSAIIEFLHNIELLTDKDTIKYHTILINL